jgi:hypothetical protein
VILAEPDPSKKTAVATKLPPSPVAQKNVALGKSKPLKSLVSADANAAGKENKIRPSEAILADIEKMVKKSEAVRKNVSVVVPEVMEPVLVSQRAPTPRKSSGVRPHQGVVISALKSQIQREQIAGELLDEKNNQPMNPFARLSIAPSPGTPMAVDFKDAYEVRRGETETITALRRQRLGVKKNFL